MHPLAVNASTHNLPFYSRFSLFLSITHVVATQVQLAGGSRHLTVRMEMNARRPHYRCSGDSNCCGKKGILSRVLNPWNAFDSPVRPPHHLPEEYQDSVMMTPNSYY